MPFKQAMVKRALSSVTLSETQQVQAIATILAETEHELFAATAAVQEAADAGDLYLNQTPEQRRDELLDLADAAADQNIEEWWWAEKSPDLLEEHEKARQYADLDKREWREKIQTWADLYREHYPEIAEGKTAAQVADYHTRSTFGVDLATFVDLIVEWRAAEHVEGIVRSRLDNVIHQLYGAADHVQDLREENQRLRERVDELESAVDEE